MCRHSGCVVICRDGNYLEGLFADPLLLQHVSTYVHLDATKYQQ